MGTGNVDMAKILDFPLFSKTLALAESVVARSRNAEGIKQVLLCVIVTLCDKYKR